MLQETINIGPLLPDEPFIVMMIDSDAAAADDYRKYTKLVVRRLEIAKNSRHKELDSEQIDVTS